MGAVLSMNFLLHLPYDLDNPPPFPGPQEKRNPWQSWHVSTCMYSQNLGKLRQENYEFKASLDFRKYLKPVFTMKSLHQQGMTKAENKRLQNVQSWRDIPPFQGLGIIEGSAINVRARGSGWQQVNIVFWNQQGSYTHELTAVETAYTRPIRVRTNPTVERGDEHTVGRFWERERRSSLRL